MSDTVTANIDLAIGSRRLQTRISIPVLPMPAAGLLPIARALTDAAVAAAGEDAAALGRPITCRAGCAACCRHLVPITEVEARRLRDVIEEMPEPRRSVIQARFAVARGRLREAGMLQELENPDSWDKDDPQPRGMDYFHLGIDCPFLEDESCTIYPERPLVCRDYVVISSPERCRDPRVGEVKVVKMPLETWRALARTANPEPGKSVSWIPLILAPAWADAHPEPPPTLPGPELVRRFFSELTGKEVPPTPQEMTCPPVG
jgi:Fe-S-cluster containining protein